MRHCLAFITLSDVFVMRIICGVRKLAIHVASLLPEFTKLPPQCFECKLQNSPLRPDAENTRVFQDLVGEAEELTATVLSISNNVCTVALTYDVDNEEVNVSEVLFGKKNVDSTLSENAADVLFVDYGNAENVPLHSLKVLDAKFLDVPPYAIKCKLNGVVPIQESWTDDVINTFHGIVDDCLLGVTFISKDIPAIVNLTKEDKDVAQTLVDMELANVDTSTETGETYAEDHLTSPIEDQPCSFTNDQSYPRRKFTVGSKVDAKVCYVDSCDRFYIMPVDFSTNLDTVTHLLKILYGDKEDQQSFASQVLDDIKPLTPCVAKYSEDETWYRALITEVDGDNICVSFVDYGNSEIISLDNLKPITRELFEVPVVATECSLFGMQAVEGKEQEISDKLEEFYVEEVDVELEICACNPLKVKLYHNGADFITDLISEGLAVAAECNVDSDIQPDAEIENESSQNSNIVVSPPVSVDLETNPVSVKFYEIENNVAILYAVPIDLNEELENLQAHLNDVYNEMERKPVAFENMTFCVAKYSEDECWYRAQILSSESENIKVKFIDYGNSEVIDVKDINVLIPEFAQKPQFSIRCILPCYKVIEDKKDEVCSTLDECIYEEGVQLKPCQYTHTAQGLCLSAVIYSEENIFETMLNNELVTLQFPVNNQVSSTFVATVEKFEDGIFFIIPLELKKERESFQLELQKLCTSDATPPEIDQKHFYAVKKSDDWYRAVLMTSDGDSAVVKLIDFESSLQVKISDLVLLPSCFYHQPLLLQPCHVDGLDSIPAAFIDKFASDVVNNVVPVTCSLLDPVPKCYPLKVKLFVYNNEICDILKNINDCSEINIKIEENTMEEVTKNVLEQDNIKQKTEMEDNPDSEIIFENNVESQEIIEGESEEKELLNDTVEKEVKTNNNSEDLHTDETMPIIIKADAPTCDSSEDIICEEETEVLPSVDNNEESVECLAEQKMDLTEQNVMSEDSAVSEELNSLEKISENIEQNAEANIPNVGVCAPKNTSAEGELHYNVEVNLKSNEDDDQVSEADYEEAVEDISHSGNASLSNNNLDGNFEEECQETDLQTEISHQDICIKDSMFVDSENKHSDNFEFKNKLEENFQFLNEESNEDKFNKEGEAESIEKVDQSRSKCLEMNEMKEECNDQSVRNESAENLEASCELNTCEIAGASKVSDEIFKTDESVDENEKNQVESKQYLKEMDLEISKAENEDQKFSGFSIVDAINENEDESINIKFDKTEVSVSSESEAKSASIVNNECQDSNKAIECTDASQTVAESSNVIADIDSNLNTSSDDHKESVEDSELQSETIINTDDDECQDGNLAVECTDVSESASQIVPESNFSEKTNSNLNTTSNDDKGSIEVPEIQSEIIINTDNDECQDDDLAIECTDTSESTFQIVPESSNFFKDTNCDLSTTSDDHKKNFEVFEQSETIDQSKGFESSDICTSKAVELFESESVLATDFDSSDANSTGLFSNRHISGKINALVSEISISGNSVILAITPSDLLDELSQFSNLLQSTYSSKNIPFEKNVSQLCAILSDDDLWYRAKVLGFSDGNFISLLIDNGLCKDIDVAKVRNLEPEHEIIPPFSIWCTLASVSCLDDKTEEVVEYLKTLAKDKLIEINVIEEEEPCKVSMFVDGVNVLNELLKKNLVIQTLPVNCVEANQSATISYCHISDSDIKLFINLAAQLEDLENLKKCMQVSYSTEAFEIPASESSVCAVFYKDLWLRAQMLSSEGKPCAKLIDFGEYIYDVQNFYALLPEYCLYPPFAIPCPVSLTCKLDVESSKDLKNILGSSKFTVKLETVPETQAVSAVIVDKDLINKIKKFGICFEYSTRAAAEIFADGDNVKNNCLKLTCKELDDIKLETLNEMGESVSTKEYVSLLNESFSTDSSID
ncbi:tudor domain-containing 6-like [Uloborus diversus]|uniref:tudor domain-containing 6-like n=1 Tax=Uloborus diversus TaxID=327109 RepID=UPI00240919CC|nr:tudor domain-containing 6-like [Uloborus diversus]